MVSQSFLSTIVNSPEMVRRRPQPRKLWIDIANESSEAPRPGIMIAGRSDDSERSRSGPEPCEASTSPRDVEPITGDREICTLELGCTPVWLIGAMSFFSAFLME